MWAVARGRVYERVARVKSSKRRRSTTVRPDPAGRSHAAGDAVDQRRRATASISSRRPRRAAQGPLRTDRAAAAADLHAAGVAVVGERVEVAAGRPARASTPAPASGSCATSPTVAMPRSRSLAAVTGPTPHSRSTGSGWRNDSSLVGRDHEQAVGLGHAARHLGEELRAGHADGDRAGRPARGRRAAAARRSRWACPTPAAGRPRRGRPRRSTAPRPAAWCPRTPRTPPCWPRSRPTCGARPRRPGDTAAAPGAPPIARSDAEGPGLVAGRQHHARRRRSPAGPADEDRRAARPRRRRRRGRRAGSWRHRTRTHVRIRVRASRRVGGWRRSVPSLDGVRHHRGARRR